MPNSLLINRSPSEVRVALLEEGQPVEIYVERQADRGVVGNVYRGRVVRVLPGIQAAFVDIGLERTGFLYVDDAVLAPIAPGDDVDHPLDGPARAPEAETISDHVLEEHFRKPPIADISDVLKTGQEILVQVQKEPLGTKGARLTRRINLPGRHLVFMPFAQHIGVSRRITDEAERERLKSAVGLMDTVEGGYIVRTAAEGEPASSIEREAGLLRQMWNDINTRGQYGACPRLVFADLDLVLRAARDLFSDDVKEVLVDTDYDEERVREFVRSFGPEADPRVHRYLAPEPIFDHYGIEVELERALERRVWLKCGGYIVIDQAEALAAIDVNSGRFVGKSSIEDTITQINLEAVKEIAYQLRLRNIGGIIIIDFIDMFEASNREKVLGALNEALRHDKVKSAVVRMSEIGLVEMTRKRVRESLGQVLTETCPYCKGRGSIKSQVTIAHEILRAVSRSLAREKAPTVLVNTEPALADALYDEFTADIERIETAFDTQVIPVARQGYHREHFEIVRAVTKRLVPRRQSEPATA